ncbi:hypothetical protein M0R45_025229 [Rubus argutus]|uniref:Uncharacterized protein n=1 Tax=Rubus argutus TaxID=59490 RepID=A0AAW1WVQ5_RUBAR
MDPLVNADNDYAMLDELLLEGGAAQTLSVNPVDLSIQKTDNVVNLEVPKQRYVLVETAEEEMPSSKNKKGVHALYLVDDVKKEPITREQLVKVEKDFEVAEAGKQIAIAAQEKLRAESLLLHGKLDAEKKKTQSLQAETIKLSDEVAHLKEEVTRLKLAEDSVQILTDKVDAIPTLVVEAAQRSAEQAVEDFKKSPEFASLLKQQHLKSVRENVKLYRDRGWLNVEKFKADREADKAAARATEEEAAKMLETTRPEGGEKTAETPVSVEREEGSEDDRDRSSSSVPETPGGHESTF